MRDIATVLRDHPFFADLDDDTVRQLCGCAMNIRPTVGEHLFAEGAPADRFFVLREGRVALQVHVPGGSDVVVDTADAGDVVGWAWLIPPYRWQFDARVVAPCRAVVFDAECLRQRCRADPALGYSLLQRVATVMYAQLSSARLRLADVYEVPRGSRR
jgi:CRP/FNR family transcriptional regulator, cyclic AMP receptor protein